MIDAIVTGASGFIGRSLCARLRADGQNVLALTSANGDVSSADTWKALPPAKVLYQLAGKSYVPASWTQSPEFMAVNVVGTEHALAYCQQHCSRLVLASAYVYGIPERLPICESDKVAPNNPYALSKRMNFVNFQLCTVVLLQPCYAYSTYMYSTERISYSQNIKAGPRITRDTFVRSDARGIMST